MVSPLVAWTVVLLAVSITALLWLGSAPIISALYTATSGQLSEQATGPAMMMRLEFIAIPIVIDVLFVIWAFLVTTRRQAVTTPGGW